MHSLFLAEEERILGEIKREWWSQTEKDGEKGSSLSDQSVKGGIRERRELWTGRQERDRERERERERESEKEEREREGHIEGEHWPGAPLRAAPPFSPFSSGDSERRGKKKRGDEKEQKNPLSIRTYGSAEAGGAPYSCTNLTSALLE